MDQKIKKYIDILIGLEPKFKEAGELAIKLRQTAKSHNKYQTGNQVIDIVTEADLAVQEYILSEMAKTELVECELLAEENTPSVSKFKGSNGLVLTLDPIDGTLIYASNGRFFSIIVGLNDKKTPQYTYFLYPAVNWSRRIIADGIVDSGPLPQVNVNNIDLSKTISCSFRNPQKTTPEIYNKLAQEGYQFRQLPDITKESSSTTLFFLDQVAGYYTEKPGAWDGLGVLHYAQVKNYKIFSDIDISKAKKGDHNMYYPGWYVVLRK